MPLTIPDSVLEQAGLSEAQARVEIACRLFEMRRLSLWQAAQWAGLERLDTAIPC
jgi:predicted HTH domain antitoxin